MTAERMELAGPYELARAAFNGYAAMNHPDLPADRDSALQVLLARWQSRNFGAGPDTHATLGIIEELGEGLEAFLGLALSAGRLAHSVLKADQRIRGFGDREKARRAVADGVADMTVYAMQLCTAMRLDYGTLLRATAQQVLQRDWKANPSGTGV